MAQFDETNFQSFFVWEKIVFGYTMLSKVIGTRKCYNVVDLKFQNSAAVLHKIRINEIFPKLWEIRFRNVLQYCWYQFYLQLCLTLCNRILFLYKNRFEILFNQIAPSSAILKLLSGKMWLLGWSTVIWKWQKSLLSRFSTGIL